MSRLSLLATTLLFTACAVSTGDERQVAAQAEQDLVVAGCNYHCQPCPKGHVCALSCTPIGKCKNQCVEMQLCIQGYQWDAKKCQCVPMAPCATADCGPALGMPNTLCADGVTVAGPTGQCLRQGDGSCGWEVIRCPL